MQRGEAGAALQFSQGRTAARRENWLSARGSGPQGRGNRYGWRAAQPSAACGRCSEAEQGQTQRPRPADETGSCVWRSAPVFASGHRPAPRKSAKRKRQTQRPRPADETGSCVWRSAPVFASTLRGAKQKSAKRKRNAVCFLQAGSVPRCKNRAPQPGGFR